MNTNKGYTLRNSDFILPHFNPVKYGKHSLKYLGPLLWSMLIKEERGKNSLIAFRTNKFNLRCTDLKIVYYVIAEIGLCYSDF